MGQSKTDKQSPLKTWTALGARLIIGSVLLFSGLSKILGPVEEFAVVIETYKVISPETALFIAQYLPWVEYVLGGFLILGYSTPSSALGAGALFALFLSVLTTAQLRGLNLGECGCFGRFGPHWSINTTIMLDTLFVALAIIIFFDKKRVFSLDRWLLK